MSVQPPILTLADFADLVGRSWGSGANEYTLVAAVPLPVHEYPGRSRDPFALTFRAPGTEPHQSVLAFDLPTAGPTEILLVPVAAEAGDILYEAVFT